MECRPSKAALHAAGCAAPGVPHIDDALAATATITAAAALAVATASSVLCVFTSSHV